MARKLIFKRLIPLVVGNTYTSEGRLHVYAKGKRVKRIVRMACFWNNHH